MSERDRIGGRERHMATSKISEIETIIGRVVKRDIRRMVDHARGGLESAARAIAEHPEPHVGIVTGFFFEHADPPSPETDGLGGTGHIAAALASYGASVTVITDAPCAKAVWSVVDIIPENIDLEVTAVSDVSVRRLRDRLQHGSNPLTHLVSIERPGPGADGRPHRQHGWDMSRVTAPLHLLFKEDGWDRPWTTISIGDGGNEIGMGSLPRHIIEEDIPNGPLVAATTPTDHLIVAGVSNWGGYGLVAAMAALQPDKRDQLLKYLNRETDLALMKAMVEVGQAVDDSRPDRKGTPQMTVDCLPWEEHAELIDALRRLLI